MNPEYLLDAIGLLDDDLIQEAETCTIQRRKPNYRAWMGWAACFAVVIVLGYGLTHIRMGSQNTNSSPSSGAASNAPNSESSAGCTIDPSGSFGGSSLPSVQEPQSPGASGDSSQGSSASNAGDPSGDWLAAIMVDGVVYWSTDTPVSAEVDESAIRTVTSYTDTQPEEDGQTNFDRSLTTRYAMTDDGLLVQINGAWVLFDPVPPWER